MWSIDLEKQTDRGVGATALFVRIADAIAADIRRGVLRAGDRLPSTRTLARDLAVNRNTIVAAYDEIVAQGWATSRGAGGTFVAADLPHRPVLGPDRPPRGLDRPPRGPDRPPRGPDRPPRGPDRPPRGLDRPPRGLDRPPRQQRDFERAARNPERTHADATRERRQGPSTAHRSYERDGRAFHHGLADATPFEFTTITLPITPVPLGGAKYIASAGIPDPRLFPHAVMARAYRRALKSRAATSALTYADPMGTPRLREAIAAMLRERRAMPVGPEHVLVTRGSQMALDLAARLLLKRGDTAAVEALGYHPAWRALEAAGGKLTAVPLDASGLVVEAIPRGTRVLYTTPHHQYPTTVLMPQARRLALLERARRDRFAILEDDYDHEFHFEGRPVAPLASADRDGSVIYVGSLSKILAPGLRLGFVAAPVPVIAALTAIRAAIDRQGDHVLELAVAELIEDGEIQRHAHKQRRAYGARRDALANALAKDLGSALAFELPAGGITLWARADDDIQLDRWRERALAKGVAVAIGRDFALDRKPRPFVRLAFARHDEAELVAIVKLLAGALPARSRG